MYLLSQKYSNVNDFQRVYHHFKPYFKFFISKLNQILEKTDISYFCIVDDTSIILKSLEKVINSCKIPNIEVIKAYDGVEALGLYKID